MYNINKDLQIVSTTRIVREAQIMHPNPSTH